MSSSESEPRSLDDQTQTANGEGFSVFLSLILGFSAAAAPPSQNHQEGENQTLPVRLILIYPLMIDGSQNLDLLNKEGPLPASKAAIEALPAVTVAEEGSECAICLGECGIGGIVKEMPCKHRYHSGCIEKWLGIHGSCPVCRYKMPVENNNEEEEEEEEEEERGERRGETDYSSTAQDMEIDEC